MVLVVRGLLTTAVLARVMAYAQDHLKRMLAFVTIGHVGLFLAGVAMLPPPASARSRSTSSPTAARRRRCSRCVGIVQRRLGPCRRVSALRGARPRRCGSPARPSWLAALLGTGCRCTGPFLGKALLEDALSHGVGSWAVVVAIGVTALTGATLLRAAGASSSAGRQGGPTTATSR